MLKNIALATFSAAAIVTLLTAADFWSKKPYTDWTPEEGHKMISDSPWATEKTPDSGQPVLMFWQSALPVKRATSPQNKAVLDRIETVYLLRMTGIPNMYRAKTDADKIKMATTLKIKGKEAVHPDLVQLPEAAAPKGFGPPGAGAGKGFGGGGGGFGGGAPKGNNFQFDFQGKGGGGFGGGGGGGKGGGAPGGGGGLGGGGFGFNQSFDVFFAFPKSLDIKVENQEMEFETNIGGFSMKHKFKLKDMVYEGKLEI